MLHAEIEHLEAGAAEDEEEGRIVERAPEVHPTHGDQAGGGLVLCMDLILCRIGVAIQNKIESAEGVPKGSVGIGELAGGSRHGLGCEEGYASTNQAGADVLQYRVALAANDGPQDHDRDHLARLGKDLSHNPGSKEFHGQCNV